MREEARLGGKHRSLSPWEGSIPRRPVSPLSAMGRQKALSRGIIPDPHFLKVILAPSGGEAMGIAGGRPYWAPGMVG